MIIGNTAINHCGMPIKNGFLLDMDGVIYRGNELIPGSEEFIKKL